MILEDRENAVTLLSELLGCSERGGEVVMLLMRMHGSRKVIEATQNFIEDKAYTSSSFEAVIFGMQRAVIARLHDLIEPDLHTKLSSIKISTTEQTWGIPISYGQLDEGTAMALYDMVKWGINLERVNALNKAYRNMER